MWKSFPAVITLIAANAIVYLAPFFVLNLRGPLYTNGALYFPGNDHFQAWQFVTSMFLHSPNSAMHILFNMIGLFSFGLVLERMWGFRRFLVFYFACGIGAGLIHAGVGLLQFQSLQKDLLEAGVTTGQIESWLRNGRVPPGYNPREVLLMFQGIGDIYSTRVVGASGAIYGIMVAFGITHPNAKLMLLFLPIPIAAKYVIPALLLLDLFSGVTGFSIFGGGIAHFAHIGGALIGFLLMMLWRKRTPAPATDWRTPNRA